jgi:hypothetical protein
MRQCLTAAKTLLQLCFISAEQLGALLFSSAWNMVQPICRHN